MNIQPLSDAEPLSAIDLQGLDDIFEQVKEDTGTSTGTDNKSHEDTGTDQGTAFQKRAHADTSGWLTVEESAHRLGISANAVIKRLGKNKLTGRKVPGQFGDKWLVDPSCIPGEIYIHISDSESEDEPTPAKGTDPSKQNSTGSAKGTDLGIAQILSEAMRQQTEQIRIQNELIRKLSAQVEERDSHIRLLTDSQHKSSSWFQQFSAWFKGKRI